jgi:hypothetical protein
MGRQIQIFFSDKDNKIFSDFLKENFDCTFYQNFSPTIDGLIIQDFNNTYHKHSSIYIHNNDFLWTPTYKQTQTNEKLYYIDNKSIGPIIEFSKTNIDKNQQGRIYWSKFFSGNPDYNITEFEKFYNAIVKWIKQNTKGTVKWAGCNIHYLDNKLIKNNNPLTGI